MIYPIHKILDTVTSLAKVLLEDKWYRWFLYGMVLLGGISFLVAFYLVWLEVFPVSIPGQTIPGRDFEIAYRSALAFSRGEVVDFVYFPLTIFYYLPLSYLSFYPAFFVITLWNLLMALTITIFATKILSHYQIRLPAMGKWLIFSAYIFFTPVLASLNSGGVNTLAACFITVFYYFLCVRDKNIHAGLSLAIATLFKLFPTTLILFAAIQKRFRFILAFVLILALCFGLSVLLLGVDANVNFFEHRVTFHQGPERVTASVNSAFSGIVYKSMEFLNVPDTTQSVISITWLFVRVAFVFSILGYLYLVGRRVGVTLRDTEWSILLFSLFSIMMTTLPNHAWVYYASCLVLPSLLCIFCLKLSRFEKTLLAFSVAFFSFNTHIDTIFMMMGGVFNSMVYLVHPSVVGNLLFFAFVLLKLVRLKRKGYYPHPTGIGGKA